MSKNKLISLSKIETIGYMLVLQYSDGSIRVVSDYEAHEVIKKLDEITEQKRIVDIKYLHPVREVRAEMVELKTNKIYYAHISYDKLGEALSLENTKKRVMTSE